MRGCSPWEAESAPADCEGAAEGADQKEEGSAGVGGFGSGREHLWKQLQQINHDIDKAIFMLFW